MAGIRPSVKNILFHKRGAAFLGHVLNVVHVVRAVIIFVFLAGKQERESKNVNSSTGKGHSFVDPFDGGDGTGSAGPPSPRPLVLAEWDPFEGVGGRIAFFAPSEAVARQVTEGLGQLSWTMFGDFPFYQLAVHPCQSFDKVFDFMLRTAGPGGVFKGW